MKGNIVNGNLLLKDEDVNILLIRSKYAFKNQSRNKMDVLFEGKRVEIENKYDLPEDAEGYKFAIVYQNN